MRIVAASNALHWICNGNQDCASNNQHLMKPSLGLPRRRHRIKIDRKLEFIGYRRWQTMERCASISERADEQHSKRFNVYTTKAESRPSWLPSPPKQNNNENNTRWLQKSIVCTAVAAAAAAAAAVVGRRSALTVSTRTQCDLLVAVNEASSNVTQRPF